jgi:hypothetical protein
MNQRILFSMVTIMVSFAGLASAQPVINGTLIGDEGAYGAPLSIQNTDTQFGDSINGDPREAFGGSEIDQVFGTVANGRLYMLVTGNLEQNFNKLSILIDSSPSLGVNQIVGADLPVGVDGFCCGGFGTTDGALQRMNGMKLDAGFTADHFLTFSNGTESVGVGGTTQFWAATAHYADLTNGPSGRVGRLGMQLDAFGMEPGLGQGVLVDKNNNGWNGPDDPLGMPAAHEFAEPVSPSDPTNSRNHRDLENIVGLRLGIDNSNTVGVVQGADPWDTIGDPENVKTGFEFSIPLSEIGNPAGGSTLKITAFINGNGHHYASNQFAGVGVLRSNLGGDGTGGFTGNLSGVDLSAIPGDQFVSLTLPPSAIDADFNDDGSLNCADIDALTNAVAMSGSIAQFDLNGDGMLSIGDVDRWRSDAGAVNIGAGRSYRVGDANLDGSVDGSDFGLWNSNKFTANKDWCRGNFNADTFTDGSDFGLWNANKFTSSDSQVVPEPGLGLWTLLTLLAGSSTRSRLRS